MSKILKDFGKNLKKYRLEKGYTQEKFAEIANFSVTYISLLESGNYNTSLINVEKFADILCVDYIKLFEKFNDSEDN